MPDAEESASKGKPKNWSKKSSQELKKMAPQQRARFAPTMRYCNYSIFFFRF